VFFAVPGFDLEPLVPLHRRREHRVDGGQSGDDGGVRERLLFQHNDLLNPDGWLVTTVCG
jgi:hypothetical protein